VRMRECVRDRHAGRQRGREWGNGGRMDGGRAVGEGRREGANNQRARLHLLFALSLAKHSTILCPPTFPPSLASSPSFPLPFPSPSRLDPFFLIKSRRWTRFSPLSPPTADSRLPIPSSSTPRRLQITIAPSRQVLFALNQQTWPQSVTCRPLSRRLR
jgi:hypothetical protein